MTNLNFGIVGTGFIAKIVADSIERADGATLSAVSSRNLETARTFVGDRTEVDAVQGLDALLAREDIDAVYIATPTSTKEAIAIAAFDAGKHVLIDKPLPDRESVARMSDAAARNDLVFMDATHFVHNPRTRAIRDAIPHRIGAPKSLHTAFYFPFDDRANIRFDQSQEPMGTIGDMGWYSMRAVVEYLQPEGELTIASVIAERDDDTSAVIRASGLVGFASGETSTFDIGYTAGTAIMELLLFGTAGIITMDDFVLDWHDSFPFQNADVPVGYVHRSGMATRKNFEFVETPSEAPGDVLMIERFAEVAGLNDRARRDSYAQAARLTQTYLDQIWHAASK
ncbi:MAG: Gfo/Idh/MocA family oxidoreductase [Woeseiaceae bacterium]|nr:Gfo/Idh/MocA family oxidoreductase [Woeseiaceae bacterium]